MKGFKGKLDQGPLKRSSSLLMRVAREIINKKEMVVWNRFWRALGRGHGEKLAHGLVLWESCCSAEMLWPRGTGATSVVSGLPVANQA